MDNKSNLAQLRYLASTCDEMVSRSGVLKISTCL